MCHYFEFFRPAVIGSGRAHAPLKANKAVTGRIPQNHRRMPFGWAEGCGPDGRGFDLLARHIAPKRIEKVLPARAKALRPASLCCEIALVLTRSAAGLC